MHEWASVCGNIRSGKTQTIYKILREFLKNDQIQICGFFQPSREKPDTHDRDGYDLAIIRENDVLYKIFAIKNMNAPPNTMPWFFNTTLFEEVAKTANNFKLDGRPVVLLLDELGQLECHQKGHIKAIEIWLNRLIKQPKVFVIFTTAETRFDLAKEIFISHNYKESDLKLKAPVTNDEIKLFVDQITKSLLT